MASFCVAFDAIDATAAARFERNLLAASSGAVVDGTTSSSGSSNALWRTVRGRRLQLMGALPSGSPAPPVAVADWALDPNLVNAVNRVIDLLPDQNEKTGSRQQCRPAPFGCAAEAPDKQLNILINQYAADGAGGILPHTDGPAYDPFVCILSFGASVPLTFQPRRARATEAMMAEQESIDDSADAASKFRSAQTGSDMPIDRDEIQRELEELEVELTDRLDELQAEVTDTGESDGVDAQLGVLAGWFHETAAFRWHQLRAILQLAWLGVTPQQVGPMPPAWRAANPSQFGDVGHHVGCSKSETENFRSSVLLPPPNADCPLRPFSVLLPPRSLICFWGPLYEQWLHGISPAAPVGVDFLPAVSTITPLSILADTKARKAGQAMLASSNPPVSTVAPPQLPRLSAFASFARYRRVASLRADPATANASAALTPTTAADEEPDEPLRAWAVAAASGHKAAFTAFNGTLTEIVVNVRTGPRTSLTYRRVRSAEV